MFSQRFRWGLVALLLFCASSFSQTLLVELSDSHAVYNRFPLFLKSLRHVEHEFESAYPQGKKVLLLNGDFNGTSAWAVDRGQLLQDFLVAFGSEWEVVKVLGNHEEFDWHSSDGNGLFVKNTLDLQRAFDEMGKPPFYWLAGNIEKTELGHSLFRAHQDFTSPSGQSVRIVGMVLEEFFQRSNYETRTEPSLFTGHVEDLLPFAQQALLEAAQDGIENVIFSAHEAQSIMLPMVLELENWKSGQPALANLQVRTYFSGHDHLKHVDWISSTNTPVIDSGSNFEFTAMVYHDDWSIESLEVWPYYRQQSLFEAHRDELKGLLKPYQLSIYEKAVSMVSALEVRNSRVIGETRAFPWVKTDLKVSPTTLGSYLANSMRDWAIAHLDKNSQDEILSGKAKVVGFYNSSCYRLDEPLREGPLCEGVIRAIYPFPESAQIQRITGRQLKEKYTSLRLQRANFGVFSPQISSNLLDTSRDLQNPGELRWIDPQGNAQTIEDQEIFYLALDSWLGRNGYEIETWKEIDRLSVDVTPMTPLSQTEVLLSFLPDYLAPEWDDKTVLESKTRCQQALIRRAGPQI